MNWEYKKKPGSLKEPDFFLYYFFYTVGKGTISELVIVPFLVITSVRRMCVLLHLPPLKVVLGIYPGTTSLPWL